MDRRNNRRAPDGISVLTANNLLDGRVVWLDKTGQWRHSITHAQVFPNHEMNEILAHQVTEAFADKVIGIYGVQIKLSSLGPEPVTIRERIRAFGPLGYIQHSRAIHDILTG